MAKPHDPDFPLDDEQGTWNVVGELTNHPGRPITINYGGKQIILPREVAKAAMIDLAAIFHGVRDGERAA
jgi:hypothetical protein